MELSVLNAFGLEGKPLREAADGSVGHEQIDLHVVFLPGDLVDNLVLERESAGDALPVAMGEEAVVEPAPAADSVTRFIKAQTWHDDHVDIRHRKRHALG